VRASSIYWRMSVDTEGEVGSDAIIEEESEPEIELEEEVDT